jgi:cytochrome oxidase assembly protein ShyY1
MMKRKRLPYIIQWFGASIIITALPLWSLWIVMQSTDEYLS